MRCVRGGAVKIRISPVSQDKSKYPYNVKISESIGRKEQSVSTGRARPPFGGRRFIQRLDKDGDGQVSRSEFDGPKNRFGFHDKNNDGYLSEDEAPKGPPPRGGRPPAP